MFHHGGIYLDTDVELVQSLDVLLDAPAFFGFEDSASINTGIGFGAAKNNPIVSAMLEDYNNIHFRLSDGTLDKLPCPIRNTNAITSYLPEDFNPSTIVRIQDAVIYPPEYFCPLSADGITMRKTQNTYSIHWFSATWLTEDQMVVHKYRVFRGKCEKLLGKRLGGYTARFVYLFYPKRRAVLKRM